MYSLLNIDVSLLLGVILLCSIGFAYLSSQTYKLRHIPSVGSGSPILSYFDAFRFLFHSQEMIAQGTRRYPDGIFKIPDFFGWNVVVNGPKLIAEYRKLPENIFSSRSAFQSSLHHEYTFHPTMTDSPRYHISIIRSPLTRSIAKITSEIHDEVIAAFEEYFPINIDSEWEHFPAIEILSKIACRASNRVFVGLPLCRDPDFITISVNRTGGILKTALLLNLCPKPLQRFVAPLISEHRKEIETVQRLLIPLIEARRQEMTGNEEHATDPAGSDVLTWALKDPYGKNASHVDLTCRVLALNFASIHTTSITLTHALYDLAAYPEYAELLREEAARVVESDGWTKAAVEKMEKVDSFVKESMRLNTIGELLMTRIALEDYTFAQTGIFIPRGTFLSVATHDAHFDGDTYADPTTFDGLRFVKLKRNQTIVNERHFDMTTTSLETLAFGTGVHACPGRFFAANEIKLILAHMVLNYDVKFEKHVCGRPLNKYFKASCIPDPAVKLLFRRRQE